MIASFSGLCTVETRVVGNELKAGVGRCFNKLVIYGVRDDGVTENAGSDVDEEGLDMLLEERQCVVNRDKQKGTS